MDRKQLYNEALREYDSLITFLKDYVFPLRKDYERTKNNNSYSIEAGICSFDVLLQYSLLELALADNKLDQVELVAISYFGKYRSFPLFLNDIGIKNVTWEDLLSTNTSTLLKVLEETKEYAKKISLDFITSYALFDSFTPEVDYSKALSISISTIASAILNIDGQVLDSEINKNLLIVDAIKAILSIKKDNEENIRNKTDAKNLEETPNTRNVETNPSLLKTYYKQGSNIILSSKEQIDYKDKERGLVYIESVSGSGSGFLINSKGLCLTCNHVVEGNDEVFVRLDDGNGNREVKKAKVVHQDKDDDFAIVQIQEVSSTPFFKLEDNYQEVKTGDDIAIFGFPYGTQLNSNPMELEPTLNKGYIASKNKLNDKKVFYLDARSAPGNSGGPVFSLKTNKVIGYLCGSYGSDRANLVFCRSLTEYFKLK